MLWLNEAKVPISITPFTVCQSSASTHAGKICVRGLKCVHSSPLCAVVTVTFSPQNYTVTEGDPAPLMIILDKPAAKDITVAVTTMDITATGEQANCSCSKWVISLLEPMQLAELPTFCEILCMCFDFFSPPQMLMTTLVAPLTCPSQLDQLRCCSMWVLCKTALWN